MTSRSTEISTTGTPVLDCVVIGTGFAGICMGVHLEKTKNLEYRILEKEDAIGGTWRDNTYPGAACDVQSHLYSFSFEPNPKWNRNFAEQGEILEYMNHCVDKYGIRKNIRFRSEVTGLYYQETKGIWEIHLRDGSSLQSKTVVSGNGGLSRPKIPDFPGLKDFQGKFFHSARWDHKYALENRKVAVIGTGASAIQIVPAIAKKVESLTLFQRHPAWIIPKPDKAISELEKMLFANIPIFQILQRELIYWSLEFRVLALSYYPQVMKLFQKLAENFIKESIPDLQLREKVTPNYLIGCKRILLSNDFYPTLNRKNVSVNVDGISKFTKNGIVDSKGVETKLDCVIAATGFLVSEAGTPFEVVGKNKTNLNEVWDKTGAEAYLGTCISDFPNFFIMTGPNTGLGHNSMIYMIESQTNLVMDAIQKIKSEHLHSIEVKKEVQKKYNEELTRRLSNTVWSESCGSWYLTATGKNTTIWPGFTFEFRERTRSLRPTEFLIQKDAGKTFEASPFDDLVSVAKGVISRFG